MSRNLQPRRMSKWMAKAAAYDICAPFAVLPVMGHIVAKPVVIVRQTMGHIPAGGNDPTGVPDL